jgi:hypothetical protein
VTALRVLEVVHSERQGCGAIVIDEGGAMLDAWFWWYQASDGELVICRAGAHDAADPGGIATLSYGDEQRRG